MSLTSQRRTFRFRGPSSSESYNQMVEERYFDLVRLAEREGTTREKLSRVMTIHRHEAAVLSQRLVEIELGRFNETGTMVVPFGADTLGLGYVEPSERVPKIYLGSGDDVLLPSSLSVPATAPLTYESTTGVIEPEDAATLTPITMDWLDALHPARNRWSYREAQYAGVESLYFSVHLKLPMAVVNHFRANAFRLEPLLPGSMTLHGIWYRQGGEWIELPTIPKDAADQIIPLERLGSTYVFSPVLDMNEVFFAFEQPYHDGDVFPYGFRHIGVEYWPFEADYAYSAGANGGPVSDLLFTSPKGTYFDTITSVEPIWHPYALDNPDLLASIKLVIDDTEQDIGTEIGPGVNAVTLRARLYTDQGGTPALKGFRVTFTTVSTA